MHRFYEKCLPLHRVFHSIRFKVNKVGVQRYSFFYAHKPANVMAQGPLGPSCRCPDVFIPKRRVAPLAWRAAWKRDYVEIL